MCGMQKFIRTPAYKAMSDTDKLRFHEFKHGTNMTVPGADPVHSAPVVYNSNFYIKQDLFQKGMQAAIDSLKLGVDVFQYSAIEEVVISDS